MSKALNIIIAGGKTGGHLFPGIAVAKAIEASVATMHKGGVPQLYANILFVGTDAKFETQTLEQYGFAHKAIFSKPIKGGSIISKLFSSGIIVISLVQSLIIIKNFKPDFVLGVGGFSSFAVVLAASIIRIPNAIQEQNAFPGITNRVLSKFTQTIFTSFKETKGFAGNSKVRCFGNPVRRTAVNRAKNLSMSNHGHEDYNLKKHDQTKFTILVTGGSQGAASINNAFMDALELMKTSSHILEQINIIHQTGVKGETDVKERYKTLSINATVKAFFHNMPMLQDIADLVITRAGAGIISELSAKGVPAIFIPFPHAADDHQTFNAQSIVKQGGGVMIQDRELTGETLKTSMEDLIFNREKLERMGNTLKRLAMPDADVKIASYILKTAFTKKG